MERDLDKKLYNDYLNGEKQAFEFLYNKYKNRIEYFIYNIVKNREKAEDLTQETFIYIMQNKFQENSSFKYFLYLVAKSKAYNYINVEKRRNEINEKYILSESEETDKDVLDIITKEESKKELLSSIDELDDKYKSAIYLVNIEELSYEETSKILGQTLSNTKTLIHRGKKQLKRILLKKGFEEMNKVSKVVVMILCISILLVGGVYGAVKISQRFTGKARMTPTFTSEISTMDSNKVWVGTFNLVWNDLMNDVIGGKIEFEDGYSELANELNKQTFTSKELNPNSYFKIHGEENYELRDKIINGIKTKFNETSNIVDRCNWEKRENGYVLYAMLKKEFNYLEKFPTLPDGFFGSKEEKESYASLNEQDFLKNNVKYFGIDPTTGQEASKNIEVLFYNSESDFAVKLKTQEGEEVYLYRTTGEGKSFEENYQEMLDKQSKFTGEKVWNKNDCLKIPFVKINDEINYDELCGKYIKGTDWYIEQALQTIDFELNNYGGSVKSEALIEMTKCGIFDDCRKFIFDDDFILYLKEEDKQKPYFALKVDNMDVLVTAEP